MVARGQSTTGSGEPGSTAGWNLKSRHPELVDHIGLFHGLHVGLLGRDGPCLDQPQEVVVEQLHPELLAGLDGGRDLVGLAVTNVGGDTVGDHHDLERGDAAGAVLALAQGLTDAPLERRREHGADLVLIHVLILNM